MGTCTFASPAGLGMAYHGQPSCWRVWRSGMRCVEKHDVGGALRTRHPPARQRTRLWQSREGGNYVCLRQCRRAESRSRDGAAVPAPDCARMCANKRRRSILLLDSGEFGRAWLDLSPIWPQFGQSSAILLKRVQFVSGSRFWTPALTKFCFCFGQTCASWARNLPIMTQFRPELGHFGNEPDARQIWRRSG